MSKQDLLDQEVERIVKSVGIPTRPGILLDLEKEVKKDDPDFRQIEHLVVSDVGLSAALLKTINSPFYATRNKATTIRQAISILGLSTLSRLVTGLVVRNLLSPPGQISMERFWDASAKIAVTSSYLAKQLPGMDKDEAYTFGLFQDCGIPVLMQKFPDYKQTLGLANEALDRKFTDIEEERYQTNHATVGYILTKSWNLPANLSNAIRFHHEYSQISESESSLSVESQNLVALALLAEHIIQTNSGRPKSVEWSKAGPRALEHLGLSDDEFDEIVADIKALEDE